MPKAGFSFLTYNTLFNTAFTKIDEVFREKVPDIVCLQEVDTSEQNLKKISQLGLKLADYSNSFIKFGHTYGAATFYNPYKFEFVFSTSLDIASSIGEWFFTIFQILAGINKPKTVLRCDFIDKISKKKIIVCNAHLIVVASNDLRLNHLKKALDALISEQKTPMIIGGDFNYLPYKRKKLENAMKRYGLIEGTKNIRKTVEFSKSGKKEHFSMAESMIIRFISKIFSHQMKNDYIFYRGLRLHKTERLNTRLSDHYPLFSNFS